MSEEKKQPVLLYSSGIDSLLVKEYLRRELNENPILVHYVIGSRYSRNEHNNLIHRDDFIKVDHAFNFSDIEENDAFVPNRNLHLAMHASRYGDKIYIGGTQSDRVSDNNKAILEALAKVVTTSLGRTIEITSPVWDWYKSDLAIWYAGKKGVDAKLEMAVETFSCYNPTENREIYADLEGEKITFESEECLRCKACFRKGTILNAVGVYRAFKNPRIIENYKHDFENLLDYEQNPRSRRALQYIKRLQS